VALIFFVRLRDLRRFVVARLRALQVLRFGGAGPPQATAEHGYDEFLTRPERA
jgi:hypothetical protein